MCSPDPGKKLSQYGKITSSKSICSYAHVDLANILRIVTRIYEVSARININKPL
jgi:hypothetical protein